MVSMPTAFLSFSLRCFYACGVYKFLVSRYAVSKFLVSTACACLGFLVITDLMIL